MSIYTPYSQNSILKKSMAILNLVWNTHLTHPILSTPLSFLRHWGIMFVFLVFWNCWDETQTQVFKQKLWMRHFGAGSWKQTCLWSNSYHIRDFDMGPLSQEMKRTSSPLAKRYRDASGKPRCVGKKETLKNSQWLG